jgi:hypothetical protein
MERASSGEISFSGFDPLSPSSPSRSGGRRPFHRDVRTEVAEVGRAQQLAVNTVHIKAPRL